MEHIEGKAKLIIPDAKVTRTMPVFYNPVMRLNRDISVLLLWAVGMKDIKIADPLAGSGVRAIRYALELPKGMVKSIDLNDHSDQACELMRQHIGLNIPGGSDAPADARLPTISVHNKDADQFLVESRGYDLIDIDPFGSPNAFLDQSIKHLSRRGILAITATDTAPLCGTYPSACKRKYWATPKRDYLMHETGMRILIRKIQLIGAQYERALLPIYSFSHDHYFRIFLQSMKGKKDVDRVIAEHGMFNECGPMWLGQLWDAHLAMRMHQMNTIAQNNPLLQVISEEAAIDAVGFFDIHALVKEHAIGKIPRKLPFIDMLKEKGYKASETHFSGTGIRSDCPKEAFVRLLRR